MTFDPRTLGCECDRCPLQGERVVPPELGAGKPLIVGEAPGAEEEKQGRPFVGASGRELLATLRLCGRDREDVSLSNVLLCRPPGNKLTAYLRKLRRDQGDAFVSPIECCRPRLQAEIASAPSVLLLGATAFAAATDDGGGETGLARMRGYPLRLLGGTPALATFHPAFVLRSRRWTETFRSDVAKFFRLTSSRLEWTDPEILLDPSADQLSYMLSEFTSRNEIVGIDTETDGLDPETCGLRCIGLASTRAGIVVGFDSVETPARMSRLEPKHGAKILRNWLGVHPRLAVHNGVFDRPILDRFLGAGALPWSHTLDTLVAHHLVDSELPHSLDYLASRFTDAPKWKPSDRLEWSTDRELHHYCALDCAVTARLAPMMSTGVRSSEQVAVYLSDVRLQELAIQMHRAGMMIDEAERARHGARLEQKAALAEERAFRAAGRRLNLNSPAQVRHLLFGEWMLPWSTVETDSDEPSTNKDALYELLQGALPERVSEFLDALLEYRAATRSLAKDVQGLEPDSRGRVHPTWNPTGPVTGRFSCSDPQVQNVPSTKLDVESLRSMYIAAPGNVLVSADLEQAELRMVALIAGDSVWLDAFAAGSDVHKLNAGAFFSKPADAVSKSERDFAKCVAGSTRIECPGRGWIRIDTLSDLRKAGTAQPLVVLVQRKDGVSVATSRFYCGGVQPTIRLRTYSGFELEGTLKHRVLLANGTWCRLDALKIDDELALPTHRDDYPCASVCVELPINPWITKDSPRAKKRVFRHDAAWLPSIRIDARWGYLLGAIMGDGTLSGSSVSVCGLAEDGVVDEVERLFGEIGLAPRRYTTQQSARPLTHVSVSSVAFKEFLARLGFSGRRGLRSRANRWTATTGQKTKRMHKRLAVPEAIFHSPADVVKQFLAGMFDTDGTVATGGFSCTSRSRELLVGMKLLLSGFGVYSRVGSSWNKRYRRRYYSLQVPRRESIRLATLLPFRCKRKLARFAEYAATWRNGREAPTSDRVVELRHGRAEVFDLEVPKHRHYVANGLISHNTITYMFLYGGGAARAAANMRKVRDPKTGNRPHAAMSLSTAAALRSKFLKAHPAIERWWKKTEDEFRRVRLLREPVLGRVRRFLDGGLDEESLTELANFRIQAGIASLMSGAKACGAAMDALRGVVPGPLHHGHDSLMIECRESDADRVAKILESAMTQTITIDGRSLTIPAKAKTGKRWSETA